MKDAQTKREAENKAYLEEAKRVYQRMKEEKSQKKSMITKMTERMDKSLAREAQRRNEAKRVDHLAMRRLETTRLAARQTHARHNPDLLFSLPVVCVCARAAVYTTLGFGTKVLERSLTGSLDAEQFECSSQTTATLGLQY